MSSSCHESPRSKRASSSRRFAAPRSLRSRPISMSSTLSAAAATRVSSILRRKRQGSMEWLSLIHI
eukprot:1620711-Alexandrium_andersonii.AAC.1